MDPANFATSKKRHVVVLPFPQQGHIGPAMQLSVRMASKGFIITFVCTESCLSRLSQAQIEAGSPLPQDANLDIRLVGIPEDLPPGFGLVNTNSCVMFLAMMDNLVAGFEPLMEKLMLDELPVSCIISDIFLPWSQTVATRYQIPRIALWTGCVASLSMFVHIPMLVSEGRFPFKVAGEVETTQEPVQCIPCLPPLLQRDLPDFIMNGDVSDFRFQFVHRGFESLNDVTWVLVNSFDPLEGRIVDSLLKKHPKLVTIGPLLPEAFLGGQDGRNTLFQASLWPEEEGCLQWLDIQKPLSVLYISFGSIARLSAEQTRQLALALEMIQLPFLWVIRQDSPGESIYESFPDGFMERMRDKGVFVSWAPQLRVLSHPAVGGFLTHCGWNSLLESMCMGVPTAGLPQFAEQCTNLKMAVEEWKVGMAMEMGREGYVEAKEVARVVRKLMNEEGGGGELRRRAKELSVEAKKSMLEGGLSLHNLETVFEDIAQSTH